MFRTKKFFLFLFCIAVFATSVSIGLKRNNAFDYYLTLSWDGQGYYIYLPAVFVNKGFQNLDLKDQDINQPRGPFKMYPGTDKLFIKYTYGVALMEAPFFLLSRAAHKLRYGDEPGAYSRGYMKSVIYTDSFYLAMGLFILGLFLLRYFHWSVVLFTELIIWLGTNLLFYSSFSIGYSHVCSFFLIACLVYLTPLLYERRKLIHVILAGLIFGILSLIRPTDIVVGLFLLLYDVYSWQQLRERVILLLQHWPRLLWFPFFIILAWAPQFVYWHYLSGHWLIDSYQGEGFTYWKNPKIFRILFYAQNGFFIYAPLMLLSMAGLVVCLRRKIFSAWPVLLIFLVTDYICGSWWYWTFGAAYGFRPYIDFLPVLAIPLAYLLTVALQWRLPERLAFGVCIVFLLFLSVRLQCVYVYTLQGPDWGWYWEETINLYKHALFIK